jgi:hypothetical protein
MEMFRRSLPNGDARNRLLRLSIRPHQDPDRNKKTPDLLNENGKRLAGYGDYASTENTEWLTGER